jgi:hypothetical protein
MKEFTHELKILLNRYSLDNDADSPDFLLAEYLSDCLCAYERTVMARDQWLGRERWGV